MTHMYLLLRYVPKGKCKLCGSKSIRISPKPKSYKSYTWKPPPPTHTLFGIGLREKCSKTVMFRPNCLQKNFLSKDYLVRASLISMKGYKSIR